MSILEINFEAIAACYGENCEPVLSFGLDYADAGWVGVSFIGSEGRCLFKFIYDGINIAYWFREDEDWVHKLMNGLEYRYTAMFLATRGISCCNHILLKP